jgi:hypothetical protein
MHIADQGWLLSETHNDLYLLPYNAKDHMRNSARMESEKQKRPTNFGRIFNHVTSWKKYIDMRVSHWYTRRVYEFHPTLFNALYLTVFFTKTWLTLDVKKVVQKRGIQQNIREELEDKF